MSVRLLGFSVWLLALAIPGLVQAKTLSFTYLDEAVLVFNPAQDDQSDNNEAAINELPASIFIPGLPLIFSRDVKRVCRSLAARQNELMAYLPQKKTCMTLSALLDESAKAHPEVRGFGELNRDRQLLINGLKTEAYVFMQPRSVALKGGFLKRAVVAGVCSCPNPEGTIFTSSFEDLF